jgi:hypothetical protein
VSKGVKKMLLGSEGPLGGASYAVSGQFKDITREKMEEFIKKSGG